MSLALCTLALGSFLSPQRIASGATAPHACCDRTPHAIAQLEGVAASVARFFGGPATDEAADEGAYEGAGEGAYELPDPEAAGEAMYVRLSEEERESGEMSPKTINAAADAMAAYGVVCLQGALPPAQIERYRAAVDRSFEACISALTERGLEMDEPFAFREICHRAPRRYDMQLGANGLLPLPPADASSLRERAWMPLLKRLLGASMVHNFDGAVIAEPGAESQERPNLAEPRATRAAPHTPAPVRERACSRPDGQPPPPRTDAAHGRRASLPRDARVQRRRAGAHHQRLRPACRLHS